MITYSSQLADFIDQGQETRLVSLQHLRVSLVDRIAKNLDRSGDFITALGSGSHDREMGVFLSHPVLLLVLVLGRFLGHIELPLCGAKAGFAIVFAIVICVSHGIEFHEFFLEVTGHLRDR